MLIIKPKKLKDEYSNIELNSKLEKLRLKLKNHFNENLLIINDIKKELYKIKDKKGMNKNCEKIFNEFSSNLIEIEDKVINAWKPLKKEE